MSAPIFKKGDVCIVVAGPCTEPGIHLIGSTCTVKGLSPHPLAQLAMIVQPLHPLYEVDFGGGDRRILCGNSLRLKKPPEEKSTWSLIEKISGWIPKPSLMPEPA